MLGAITLSYQACSPDVSFSEQAAELASVDSSGNTSVVPKTKAVAQSFEVRENPDIDVLFVVDNSGSMGEEQKNFSTKINGFMNLIKDLNWHVALTTTDPRASTTAADGASRPWGDGQFRAMDSDTGSLFVLKASEYSVTDAQAMLANAINVGLKGSGDERAINSTYRAIERISNTPANQTFFRTNAKLIVIAISDEDECSNGTCLTTQAKSVPQNLVDLVHNTFGKEKVFMFDSIIRAQADTTCSTAAVAKVYESMAKLTGGVVGSVCATDYTSILSSIGTKTVELLKSINLDCAPLDVDGDGNVDLQLYNTKGQAITSGFSVSGTTISFSASLAEGNYLAKYTCLDK